MALLREIQALLKTVNLALDEQDVRDSIEILYRGQSIKEGGRIEEYIQNNAEYIQFKKLLIIIVKRWQELSDKYKEANDKNKEGGVSFLTKQAEKELEKAITFAKKYIKPEEFIKVETLENKIGAEDAEFTILDSKTVIYGQRIDKSNKLYDQIKDKLPNTNFTMLFEILKIILEDESMGRKKFFEITNDFLEKQGFTKEERMNFWNEIRETTSEEDIIEKTKIIDKEKYNREVQSELEKLKPYINTEKCILTYAWYINENLEKGAKLDEKDITFLDSLEELLENINEKTTIKDNDNIVVGKQKIYAMLSKWNSETKEYYTDDDLISGSKTLKDTHGYEEYCSKDKLRKLAQKEENLLYLAQRKKLNNATLYTIAMSYPVSEETLVGLYACGAFNLKKVEAYAKQKNMNFEEIKEKIKQQKFTDNQNIDLNNEEAWELLTPEERLQMTVEGIESGKEEKIQGRIEELYDIQEIANLYKEIYHVDEQNEEQNQEIQEKRKKYENLITLHNALGMQDRDDIVNILEDELSNEMLMNLYSDHVISMDILESYGEKELVMEAFDKGRIQERDIKEAIMRYPIPLEENQIYQYYQEGIFTSRNILDVYIQNRINLDTIKRINEKLPEEQKINVELREEELANLYQEAKKEKKRKNTNLEANLKYKRYGLLYQTLERANLDESEKIQSDKRILEHMTNITQEDIIELYKDNLLTLETVLEYGKDELVKKLTLQGDLRTSDARTYFESEKEKVSIEEILQNPDMDETEKLILIYTTYGDNVQKREKLVEHYISAYASDIKGENTTTREKKEKEEGLTSGKNTVTDPYQRWKLLALLDKNYSRKYVGGYLIVKLHNTQKVIIEKLYGKKYGQIEPGNSTATFGLPIEEYENLEPELIKGKKFDIAKLRKEARNHPEIITKVTHHSARYDEKGNEKNSWVRRLLEYVCDEEPEKVYSDEEIAQINECSKAIEKSRKEIDR